MAISKSRSVQWTLSNITLSFPINFIKKIENKAGRWESNALLLLIKINLEYVIKCRKQVVFPAESKEADLELCLGQYWVERVKRTWFRRKSIIREKQRPESRASKQFPKCIASTACPKSSSLAEAAWVFVRPGSHAPNTQQDEARKSRLHTQHRGTKCFHCNS